MLFRVSKLGKFIVLTKSIKRKYIFLGKTDQFQSGRDFEQIKPNVKIDII